VYDETVLHTAEFYRTLTPEEQAVNFGRFWKYTEAFDNKHGTQLWDAIMKTASVEP
jgi:hypothetical protein